MAITKQIHEYSAAVSIDAAADYFLIDPSSTGAYNKINRNVALGLSSAPLGTTDSQSPTNKTFDNTNSLTIKDGNFTLQNTSSVTKQAHFVLSGITAGQNRAITLPDFNATIASLAGVETLTNKTITSPTITGGTLDNTTVTVDSIAGHTSATIVTVANLQISNGVLNTNNSVVTANIADAAITPAKLVTGTGSGWAWSSWTPTWTNLTIGNATQSCKYLQVGKTVFLRIEITLGTTSSVGSNPRFTLPVTSISYQNTNFVVVTGFYAAAASTNLGYANWSATTTADLKYWDINVNQASVTATAPATWNTNSTISLQGFYEAA